MSNLHQNFNAEHPVAVRGWCIAAAEVEADRVRRAALDTYRETLDQTIKVCEEYVAADPAVEPLAAAVLDTLAARAAHAYRATVAESQQRLWAAHAALSGGNQ